VRQLVSAYSLNKVTQARLARRTTTTHGRCNSGSLRRSGDPKARGYARAHAKTMTATDRGGALVAVGARFGPCGPQECCRALREDQEQDKGQAMEIEGTTFGTITLTERPMSTT
jgi:hypothetical protein